MAIEDFKQHLASQIALPTALAEGSVRAARGTKYSEAVVQSVAKGRCALAEEGTYFLASNPTPQTGIAGIAAADGYNAAETLCLIRNGNTAGGKSIVLDYIKLTVTVIGASGTNLTYATHLDTGVTRYTSGGSTLTPVNPNMASSASSAATVKFGALVTTAASSDVRKLASGTIRTVVMVVGDEMLFDFGGESVQGASGVVDGSLICKQIIKHCPVVLGPEDQFLLTLNAASQAVTGASYEVEIGFWER